MLQQIVPEPHERPDVEVYLDGTWCAGEVRMQTQNDDESWTLNVAYRPPGEHTTHLVTVSADLVRPDTVDRSRGRT